MSDIIHLPVIYEGSRDLKDKTKKLIFCTQEITPEQAGKLQMMVQQFGYLALKREDFSKDEIEALEDIKTVFDDNKKSPSQTQRSVLFLLWKQNSEGYPIFDDYYKHHMYVIINHLKTKLT